jgi:hypothetical protein
MSKARDIANAADVLDDVSATELGHLDGVTSAIQTQIDSKIGSASAINPTIVDAKGDLIAATAADTVARLAVGSNDTVLTADSSTATGLKWATPSSGGMTLISTTTLTGASVTLSSIPQTYNDLRIVVRLPLNTTDNQELFMRFNADATASRHYILTAYQGSTNQSFGNSSVALFSGNDNAVTQGIVIATIPDYANTSTWKFANSIAFVNNATTTTSLNVNANLMAYNQTGAISSLSFFSGGGTPSFTSGTILLYGVK